MNIRYFVPVIGMAVVLGFALAVPRLPLPTLGASKPDPKSIPAPPWCNALKTVIGHAPTFAAIKGEQNYAEKGSKTRSYRASVQLPGMVDCSVWEIPGENPSYSCTATPPRQDCAAAQEEYSQIAIGVVGCLKEGWTYARREEPQPGIRSVSRAMRPGLAVETSLIQDRNRGICMGNLIIAKE
jgi:hypothetical protein